MRSSRDYYSYFYHPYRYDYYHDYDYDRRWYLENQIADIQQQMINFGYMNNVNQISNVNQFNWDRYRSRNRKNKNRR